MVMERQSCPSRFLALVKPMVTNHDSCSALNKPFPSSTFCKYWSSTLLRVHAQHSKQLLYCQCTECFQSFRSSCHLWLSQQNQGLRMFSFKPQKKQTNKKILSNRYLPAFLIIIQNQTISISAA